MRTVDTLWVDAPPEQVFLLASDVERWPAILPHYRWVRMLDRRGDDGIVEMAAWRPFGALRWPTWWASEMSVNRARREVRYRHVRGITTGMDVLWSVDAEKAGTRATIVHEWNGPPWPLIRRPAAEWVIGPIFVHGIASRTLAGIAKAAEQGSQLLGAAGHPATSASAFPTSAFADNSPRNPHA
jgi:ribosome-associated toxin RatA of RatAB toxin-antitoxin module